MSNIFIPTEYRLGYDRSRQSDATLADRYIEHTTIGDPELDPIMEELSALPKKQMHQFIEAGIEQKQNKLQHAPESLQNFFESIQVPPDWVDHQAFRPGIRAFNLNVELMLVAFVTGVLIEGFSTMISRSFNLTGRVEMTGRRLRQNNRQLMEIFYPKGLYRQGDGWKLSTRVRFVHARVRRLLLESDEWDYEAWGMPLSAAHVGFAISVFSQRLLDFSTRLGARYSNEERESILAIWRYSGYLMGIPESILYTTGEEAKSIYRIGRLCEPMPKEDSVKMANLLIQSIPEVANIEDLQEQKEVVKLAYRLARVLIGNELADDFEFPKSSTMLTLSGFRWKQFVKRVRKSQGRVRADNFTEVIQISVYDDHGVSYVMPDHVKAAKSINW